MKTTEYELKLSDFKITMLQKMKLIMRKPLKKTLLSHRIKMNLYHY
jgi:hypothetical protein